MALPQIYPIESVRVAPGFAWPSWFAEAVASGAITTYEAGPLPPQFGVWAGKVFACCDVATSDGVVRAGEGETIIRKPSGELEVRPSKS